jgi:hypothetical protein
MSDNVKTGKELASVNEEELAALLEKNANFQAKENADDGVKADYILLAKPGTKALKKSEKDLYIQGLAIGDFFIQKSKTNLGDTLDVVPLAFITLYQEKDGTGKDARFYGVWNKEQACSYPTTEGSYFNRQLPNGHILIPVNWVMVQVLGHDEIENGVIAYKSTGSRIWKKWKEDAKERSSSSATLVYTIKEEGQQNDNYDWTDIGFEYKENLLETDKAEAIFCLKKSNAIRESYEKHTLVGNHDVAAIAKTEVAQIEDASATEDSYESEDVDF